VVDEIDEEIEQLRRQLERLPAAIRAVAAAVDDEIAELQIQNDRVYQ